METRLGSSHRESSLSGLPWQTVIARGDDSYTLAQTDGEMVFRSRSILWSRGRLDRFVTFDRFRAKTFVFEA